MRMSLKVGLFDRIFLGRGDPPKEENTPKTNKEEGEPQYRKILLSEEE